MNSLIIRKELQINKSRKGMKEYLEQFIYSIQFQYTFFKILKDLCYMCPLSIVGGHIYGTIHTPSFSEKLNNIWLYLLFLSFIFKPSQFTEIAYCL